MVHHEVRTLFVAAGFLSPNTDSCSPCGSHRRSPLVTYSLTNCDSSFEAFFARSHSTWSLDAAFIKKTC